MAGLSGIVIHRAHQHPSIPGDYRWLMAPSGEVYWLFPQGPGYGWEVRSASGALVTDGLMTLDDVRTWAETDESVRESEHWCEAIPEGWGISLCGRPATTHTPSGWRCEEHDGHR